jgi:hypothetical protein
MWLPVISNLSISNEEVIVVKKIVRGPGCDVMVYLYDGSIIDEKIF